MIDWVHPLAAVEQGRIRGQLSTQFVRGFLCLRPEAPCQGTAVDRGVDRSWNGANATHFCASATRAPSYSLVSAVAGTRAATKLSHYIRHRRNLLSLSPIASVGVRMRVRRAIHLVFVAATLASCSALPAGGPHRRDTTSGAKSALSSGPNDIAFDYALVHIDHAAVELVADPVRSVAVGDVLQVSVFEFGSWSCAGQFCHAPLADGRLYRHHFRSFCGPNSCRRAHPPRNSARDRSSTSHPCDRPPRHRETPRITVAGLGRVQASLRDKWLRREGLLNG